MNQSKTHIFLAIQRFFILIVLITFISSCTTSDKQIKEETAYRKELSTSLYKTRDEDSLQILLQQFVEKKDDVGEMLCYKQIGLLQRESARFSDAISSHQQCLEIALKLNDTVEIVQAMNNLGTNFRRIGAHNEASQYHYQA